MNSKEYIEVGTKECIEVGNYCISLGCRESYPCYHTVIEEGYLKPLSMSGLEIYKLLVKENKMHNHFKIYENYISTHVDKIQKEFCEDELKTDYRQIGKYYVSNISYKTGPEQFWVIFNNNGIEDKQLYGTEEFLEILLKEGLTDSDFESYLTETTNSRFMKKINKYLPPEKQFSDEKISSSQQQENDIYRQMQKYYENQNKQYLIQAENINKYKSSSRTEKLKQKHNLICNPVSSEN